MNAGYTLSNEDGLLKLSDNQKNNRSWTLVYIKRGVGMYLLDGSLRCLNEGDVVILPPKVSFSFRTEDLGDEYNVNIKAAVLRFDNAWLDSLLAAFPVAGETVLKIKELRSPLAVTGPKWIKMSALLDEILSCRKSLQPVKMFAILELLTEPSELILIKNIGEPDPVDVRERLDRIDRYLQCNFCSKVSLDDVSKYVGMSRTYFSIFFKMHYKEGFSDHLTRLRVEKASVMLAHTDVPIPAIAAQCGFKTVQYFTRAFKKMKGVTPGSIRRG